MNEQISFSISDILRRGTALLTGRIKWLLVLAVSAPLLNWLAQGILTGFTVSEGEMTLTQGLGVLASALLGGLLGLVTMAAILLSASDHTLPAAQSLKLALKRLPRLILMSLFFLGVSLLVLVFAVAAAWPMISLLANNEASGFLAALFGLAVLLMVLIAAMFAFYIYFVMFPYLLVLTDRPFLDALKTSYSLIRGRFWPTAGVVIVLGLISMGISMIGTLLTFLIALLSVFFFPQWGQAVSSLAMIPFVAAATLFTQTALLGLYFTITQQMPTLNVPSLDEEPGQTL